MRALTTSPQYQNPLDDFRSYSHHFVLTACASTKVMENLLGNTANGASPLLNAVNNKFIGDELTTPAGSAYLIADTRRFSNYSITDFEMSQIYGTGNPINPTVATSFFKMKLIDTTGLTFFNMMMDLISNKLQSSQASVFYLMAIIFVGHGDNGQTTTISTCYIAMNMMTMGFEFQSSGSIFNMEFAEIEAITDRQDNMEHLNYLGDVKSVTTEGYSDTIGSMVDSLENQLNIQALAAYRQYVNDAAKTNKIGQFGKLVQYMITIPKEWRDYSSRGTQKSKNPEQTFSPKRGAGIPPKPATTKAVSVPAQTAVSTSSARRGKPAFSQISFSVATTVADAIAAILYSSIDILKMASEERRNDGTACVFKTLISVTTDDTSYIIHFDVYPYYSPSPAQSGKKQLKAGSPGAQSADELITTQILQKNTMVFDYFFTGKNSHIVDFKVSYMPLSNVYMDNNVNIGKSRFNQNAAAGQSSQDVQSVSEGNDDKSHDFNPDIRPGDPIFIPIKTKEQKKNNTAQNTAAETPEQAQDLLKAKQEQSKTLAFLHYISNLQVDLTIRGNPNILKKWADRPTRGGLPPHTSVIASKDLTNAITGASKTTTDSKLFTDILQKGVASGKQKYIDTYVQPRIDSVNKSATDNQSDDPLLSGADIATMAPRVQLNIKAPNVDYNGMQQMQTANGGIAPMFTDSFFFNGVYSVLQITTTLAGGDFHHVMTLNAIDGSGEMTSANNTSNIKNTTSV